MVEVIAPLSSEAGEGQSSKGLYLIAAENLVGFVRDELLPHKPDDDESCVYNAARLLISDPIDTIPTIQQQIGASQYLSCIQLEGGICIATLSDDEIGSSYCVRLSFNRDGRCQVAEVSIQDHDSHLPLVFDNRVSQLDAAIVFQNIRDAYAAQMREESEEAGTVPVSIEYDLDEFAIQLGMHPDVLVNGQSSSTQVGIAELFDEVVQNMPPISETDGYYSHEVMSLEDGCTLFLSSKCSRGVLLHGEPRTELITYRVVITGKGKYQSVYLQYSPFSFVKSHYSCNGEYLDLDAELALYMILLASGHMADTNDYL